MSRASQKRIFITGTDTDAGKTVATCALIRQLQQAKQSVMAVKPVAAGCELIDGQLKNTDALQMQQHLHQPTDYSKINPIALEAAIAPHIAAQEQAQPLTVEQLSQKCQLEQFDSDFVLVEGAGGWLVPLNSEQSYADFVVAENLDVVLVVGMRLGCINHALLTLESIQSHGLKLVGWIANSVEPEMDRYQQNIGFLKSTIDAPMLAEIPYINASENHVSLLSDSQIVQTASSYVNISALI
jgi:dethiobiotin synthetase